MSTLRPAPAQTKTVIFFNERFMADRYEEGCYEKKVFTIFLVCKGLSSDDGRVEKSTVLQEKRPGDGFKTGQFR